MRTLLLSVTVVLTFVAAVLGQTDDLVSPTQLNHGTTGLFNVADSEELGKPVGCKIVSPAGKIIYQNVRQDGGYCWFGPLREVGTHWVTVTYNDTNGKTETGDAVSVLVTEKTSFELTGDITTGGSFFQGYGGNIAVRSVTQNWLQATCPKNTEATITIRVNESELTTLQTDCKVVNGYVIFSTGVYDYLPIPDACLQANCPLSAWLRLGTGKAAPAGQFTLVPSMYAKDSTVEVVLFREDSRNMCLRANAVTRQGNATGIKRNGIWSPQCTSVTIVGPREFCCAFTPLDPLVPQVEFSFYISAAPWVTVSAYRAQNEGGSKTSYVRIIVPAAVAFVLCLLAAAAFLVRRLRRQAAAFEEKKVNVPRVDPKSKRQKRREKKLQAALARKQRALQASSAEPEPEQFSSTESDGSASNDSQPSVHWGMEDNVEFTNIAELRAEELTALDPPRPGQRTPIQSPSEISIPTNPKTPTPIPVEAVQAAIEPVEEPVPLAATPQHGSDFFEKNDSPRPFKSAPRYTVGGAAASLSWEQVEPQGAIEFRFNPAASEGLAGFGVDDPTPLPTPKEEGGSEEPQPAFAPDDNERNAKGQVPRGKNNKKSAPARR